jgi:hypothetical protein
LPHEKLKGKIMSQAYLILKVFIPAAAGCIFGSFLYDVTKKGKVQDPRSSVDAMVPRDTQKKQDTPSKTVKKNVLLQEE